MTIGSNYGYSNNINTSAYGNFRSVSPYSTGSKDFLEALPENDPRRKQLEAMGIEKPDQKEDPDRKPGYESSPSECETCRNRKYQDGSDEANVSFKNAAHVSPEAAGAAVRSHENQHVHNAYAKAKQDGGKVISATVSIHTSICPECGRRYVSGGTTNTQIKYPNESNPYQQSLKSADSTQLRGANLDYCA